MKRGFLLLICFFLVFSVSSKTKSGFFNSEKDTSYILSYYNDLIVRIYSGEKTHSLYLSDLSTPYTLRYFPNGYFNLGAGVNFRSFGLSLATKVPLFLNSERKHGETKRFGLQSYIYSSKFTVDILMSFLKGYYLNNSFQYLGSYNRDIEYQRPDISSTNFGLSVNYIFNHARFSYRAAFSDTERQRRKAGSLIVGGSIFSYRSIADSSLIPRGVDEKYF